MRSLLVAVDIAIRPHTICGAGNVVFDQIHRNQRESALEEQLQQAAKMGAFGCTGRWTCTRLQQHVGDRTRERGAGQDDTTRSGRRRPRSSTPSQPSSWGWQQRKVLARILEHAGFRVALAGDGREATEAFRREKDEIDRVLLDLSMPGIGWRGNFQGAKADSAGRARGALQWLHRAGGPASS
jgi:hypothetical protein